MTEFLKSLWRGERSLSFTFLFVGVLVAIPFQIWGRYASGVAFGGDEITNGDIWFYLFISWPFHAFTVFKLVSIWRSAERYRSKDGWRWIVWFSQGVVILGWVLLSTIWWMFLILVLFPGISTDELLSLISQKNNIQF